MGQDPRDQTNTRRAFIMIGSLLAMGVAIWLFRLAAATELTDLTEIFQTVGIIAALLLAVKQMQVQIKQNKASSNSIITSQAMEINRLLFRTPRDIPRA